MSGRVFCTFFSTALLLVSAEAFSHHSATVFDETKSVRKTGKVTEFIYRNPHLIIVMEVEDDGGDVDLWKIEGQSLSALRRKGFVRSTVSEGDVITVRMRPLKSGKPGGLLQGLIAADGVAYSMDGSDLNEQDDRETGQRQLTPALVDYVPPPEGDDWLAREIRSRPPDLPIVSEGLAPGDDAATGMRAGALDPDNLAKERPPAPFDLTGVWQFRAEDEYRASYGAYEFKPMPKLTPAAQIRYDAYLEDARSGVRGNDLGAQCYPVGMPRLMTRYGSLMMLQYPTAIYMVSRLNNEYRVIFLDGRERIPAYDREGNWGGESIGRWEGDTLVVETEGFIGENHLVQAGVRASKDFRLVERYRILNDGNTLAIEFEMTDPQNWEGVWRHRKFRDRVLKSDVREANCIYTDNLALPGR